jgi:ATP-dependent DNA helicase DinG
MSVNAPEFDYDALMAAAAAQPKPIDKTQHIDTLFRENMATLLDGYEPREPQIRMAKMVAQALADGRHFIAEAGCGTGKSLAYLIPAAHFALANHCRVINSTGTIALQEQLFKKDLPFVQRLFPELRFALAKGKGNYVCPLRLDEYEEANALEFNPLIDWARVTKTGDRSEFLGNPGSDWDHICVDDSCPGIRKCSRASSCYYAMAKSTWNEANIVVCNHALLCIDLSQRLLGAPGILPEAKIVVLDEAHHLEERAREAFAIQISSVRLPRLVPQITKLVQIPAEDIDRAKAANEQFFAALRKIMGTEQSLAMNEPIPTIVGLANELAMAIKPVENVLSACPHNYDPLEDYEEGDESQRNACSKCDKSRACALAKRLTKLRREVCAAVIPNAEFGGATWIEAKEHDRITLHQAPVDVGGALHSSLWGVYPTVIATSATLASGGNFNYWRQQVGCPDALVLIEASPFDYRNQGILFVPIPGSVPEPRENPLYYREIAPLIEQLLERTDGRAFVLFTNYKGLDQVYELLRHRLPWQVLKQNDAPKAELLRQFKEKNSVLFGTSSFWEGIDIPGNELSCVILTSLPFPVPSDPIAEAKADAIRAKYGDRATFRMLSLPEMILKLKQGSGRLIRTKTDRGMVAILDTRVRTRGYKNEVLGSLPGFRRVQELADIEAFFGR